MLMWFFLLLFLAGIAVAGWLAFQSYLTGEPIGANFFGPRAQRRLGVVEQASVDGRRKLILIRRDGVEHLILTGGPVDVVVETGIGAAPSRGSLKSETGEAATAVFQRPARPLGQAVNE